MKTISYKNKSTGTVIATNTVYSHVEKIVANLTDDYYDITVSGTSGKIYQIYIEGYLQNTSNNTLSNLHVNSPLVMTIQ